MRRYRVNPVVIPLAGKDIRKCHYIKSVYPRKCYVLEEFQELTGEELLSIDKQLMDLLVKVKTQLRKEMRLWEEPFFT